jgi:hypothetical protein
VAVVAVLAVLAVVAVLAVMAVLAVLAVVPVVPVVRGSGAARRSAPAPAPVPAPRGNVARSINVVRASQMAAVARPGHRTAPGGRMKLCQQ